MRFDIVRQPLMAAFVILLVIATAAMAYVGSPLLTPGLVVEPASLLGGYIDQIQQDWPRAMKTLCILLIFITGTSLGRMTVRYNLYSVHTYLAIPLYGLFSCGVFVASGYVVEYLSSLLFVFSLQNFYAGLRSGSYGFSEIFRASLYLGVLPLIYTPSVILVLVIPLAAFLFKRSIRELFVSGVGYVLPFFAVCYFSWAFGGAFTAPFETLYDAFTTPAEFSVLALPPLTLVLLGMMGFFVLCAWLCYLLDLYTAGSKSRAILLFNLLLCFITGSMLFLPCASPAAAAFVAAPVAVVLPLLLVRLDRWITLLLCLGALCVCILRILL